MPHAAPQLARAILAARGTYYLATGLWPILDRSSFEKVTGPKTDFWLVRTVGALVSAIGASMLVAAKRGDLDAQTRVLALSSAGALAAVDAGYSTSGRISKVYLLDAVVEGALAAGWLASAFLARNGRRPTERVEILTSELQPD
jgi:hypothetical protein